uniref:Uncharacterized protein n=1 Tax=Romanomermis culicivorax TaxID=13658 RepID=A0A915K0M4_ROMCU
MVSSDFTGRFVYKSLTALAPETVVQIDTVGVDATVGCVEFAFVDVWKKYNKKKNLDHGLKQCSIIFLTSQTTPARPVHRVGRNVEKSRSAFASERVAHFDAMGIRRTIVQTFAALVSYCKKTRTRYKVHTIQCTVLTKKNLLGRQTRPGLLIGSGDKSA